MQKFNFVSIETYEKPFEVEAMNLREAWKVASEMQLSNKLDPNAPVIHEQYIDMDITKDVTAQKALASDKYKEFVYNRYQSHAQITSTEQMSQDIFGSLLAGIIAYWESVK